MKVDQSLAQIVNFSPGSATRDEILGNFLRQLLMFNDKILLFIEEKLVDFVDFSAETGEELGMTALSSADSFKGEGLWHGVIGLIGGVRQVFVI